MLRTFQMPLVSKCILLYCNSDHKSLLLTVSITEMKMANKCNCQEVWVKEYASWSMGVLL